MCQALVLGEKQAGCKGPVRCRFPRRAQTLARCVHQACRVAEDDECLRASAIVLCTESVEQPPLKLFVVRLAKDLHGLHGNGVHDSPISVRMSTSLILEMRIDILLPVELANDEVEVLTFLRGNRLK